MTYPFDASLWRSLMYAIAAALSFRTVSLFKHQIGPSIISGNTGTHEYKDIPVKCYYLKVLLWMVEIH